MSAEAIDTGLALRAEVLRHAPDWMVADEPMSAMETLIEADELTPRAFADDHKAYYAGPNRVDWRGGGVLEPPLDQGDSSACTSFAIAAVIGDLQFIRHRQEPRVYSPGFIHACIGGLDPQTPYSPATALRALEGQSLALARDAGFPCSQTQCLAPLHPGLAEWSPLSTASAAKSALRKGPIVAVMQNSEEF